MIFFNTFAFFWVRPTNGTNGALFLPAVGCQSDSECPNTKQCHNGECLNPCIVGDPCAPNAECFGENHRANCRCPAGYRGNPLDRCTRAECRVDDDCPSNRACVSEHCVNPCAASPCAANAVCYVTNHIAGCRCPEHLPVGNPMAHCERAPPPTPAAPECRVDPDCPSKLACIDQHCVNPCRELAPCAPTAHCSVLDSVPVRTMTCVCPEGWVPDNRGECKPGQSINSFCHSVI